MTANELRRNSEGYPDPTAFQAILNVEQDILEDEVRFHKLLNSIFNICELSGFQIEGRVIIKDKKTGRIWR